MKIYLLFVLCLVIGKSGIAAEETNIPLGTYSGFSEGHSTVAFKLLTDGKATVTTEFYDGEGEKDKVVDQNVAGTWVYKKPVLTITFGQFKDQFKFVQGCYENRRCFKFIKSESKKKSPLNVEYDYINWDAKPQKK